MTKVNSILLWFVIGIILIAITTYIDYTLSWIITGVIFGVPMTILIFFGIYNCFNEYDYIGKGKRRTGIHFPSWRKVKGDFEIEYIFRIGRPEVTIQHTHINKLCGISSWHIHRESLRIGFVYGVDSVELFWYLYTKGKRLEHFICTIPYNKYFVIKLKYSYPIADIEITTIEGFKIHNYKGMMPIPLLSGIVFDCNIYYGGEPKAPCELVISCQETNFKKL